MSDGYTSQPLVVRPWCNHAATTVGYINDKVRFTPLADCSIGPSYAVDYEPLARLLASAPDLLAERNQLKALNAELATGAARRHHSGKFNDTNRRLQHETHDQRLHHVPQRLF